MSKKYLYLFITLFILWHGLNGSYVFGVVFSGNSFSGDTIRENQILYNGKVWRNLYTNVKEDQFLFAKIYLPGSVYMNGTSFKDLNINYDIYNDEITIPKDNGTIIQLNKEMVDSFTLQFNFKTYLFKNTDADSLDGIKGFVNVLYEGKSALYVKYKKQIALLAVDEKYDLFFQIYKIYVVKEGKVHQLNGKGDLLKVFEKEKVNIKTFMKKNGIRVSKKSPESFVPVLRYYDSLSQ
jgi:hypothetical protein